MVLSTRAKLPYPEEQRDPWFTQFLDMVRALDANVYAEWEDRNMLVMGGGTISWNALSGVLSWDAIVEFNSAPVGFYWRVAPGALTVNDGEYVYFQAVRAPINNINVVFYTGSQVPASPSQDSTNAIVFALRRGDKMYFRDGKILQTGESLPLFEEMSGGGPDNFSYKTVAASKTVRIPEDQQMIVKGGIAIIGTLILDGELELI